MPPPMPKLKGPLAKLVLTKNRAAARHNFGDRHPESGNEIRQARESPFAVVKSQIKHPTLTMATFRGKPHVTYPKVADFKIYRRSSALLCQDWASENFIKSIKIIESLINPSVQVKQ